MNELLAEPMYLAGYIERLGTGTNDMIKGCNEKGLKDLEFVQEDVFKLTIWRDLKEIRQSRGEVSSENGSDKRSEKIRKKFGNGWVEKWGENEISILDCIDHNDKISIVAISEKTGLSTSGIDKIIVRMKSDGFLKRVGPARGGHWEIIDE